MFHSRLSRTQSNHHLWTRVLLAWRQIVAPEYLRKNWGVVVAVGLLYIAFLTSLALIRHRRIKETHAYIA